MPPTLGGNRTRRALTSVASALAVLTLTLVGSLPSATRSAAVDVTPRTGQVSATVGAYTDRKHPKTSHLTTNKVKVSSSRFAAYLSFPPIALNSGEAITQATLSVTVRNVSHASRGRLTVRPVVSSWSGSKITYRSHPQVGPVIGSAKLQKSGRTVTIALDPSASAYLAAGYGLQVTRTGTKYDAKIQVSRSVITYTTGAASALTESRGNPATPVTGASITGRPVFGMYFPPYPLSLDNVNPAYDYYNRNYLQASGENGKWAAVGGLLRDRPVPRNPLSGDYQYTDMLTEVKQAMDAGLSGFTACVLTTDASDRNYYLIEKLMKASSALSSSFKVMLMPDMTAMPNVSADELARGMAALGKYDSIYKLKTGEVLVAPFYAEGRTPSFYSQVLSLMKTKYGVPAALMPIFLDANYMSSFNSVSVAFANWGIRNDVVASNDAYWPNWAAKAHALGKPWMEPVSVQDERPNQQIYDEADNTQTLRATWDRATRQGADLVMLTTWNDYSECTTFAPSVDHGYAFLELNKYFMTKYRTGSYPKISDDRIIITHRIQKASTMPTSYSAVMKIRSGPQTPRDKIEVVTLLTASADITVTIGGQDYTYTAPAGFNAALFNLAEGRFTATATRGGSQVATVTTKDAVSYTTEQQDLSYHAVMS